VLLGAKLDVVARRGEIGDDLVAWLRRPAPVGGEREAEPDGDAGEVRDLASELGFDDSPDPAADADPPRDWASTQAYAVSDPEPDPEPDAEPDAERAATRSAAADEEPEAGPGK
jgi:hypothetical protein